VRHRIAVFLLIAAALLYVRPASAASHRDSDREAELAHSAYESGYRDGYSRGRYDHFRHAEPDYRCSDYRRADSGYRHSLGDRELFQAAYRLAFRAGYADGYRTRPRARVVMEVIFSPDRMDECRGDDDFCEHPRGHHYGRPNDHDD
jgi:hypothetical protein